MKKSANMLFLCPPKKFHEIFSAPLNVGPSSNLLKTIFIDTANCSFIFGSFVAYLFFLQEDFTRIVKNKIQLAARLQIQCIANLLWDGDLPFNCQSGAHDRLVSYFKNLLSSFLSFSCQWHEVQ